MCVSCRPSEKLLCIMLDDLHLADACASTYICMPIVSVTPQFARLHNLLFPLFLPLDPHEDSYITSPSPEVAIFCDFIRLVCPTLVFR